MSGADPDDLLPEQSSTYGGVRGKKAKSDRRSRFKRGEAVAGWDGEGWGTPEGEGEEQPKR